MNQRAYRGESARGPVVPEEDVHVMAALGQDERRGAGEVSPVAAHERVRHVPIDDIFTMLDRDDLP